MGKPESVVEKYFVKRCKEMDIYQRKFTSPGRRGVPDRIAVGKGVTLFIELKSPVGTLAELQKLEIARIRAHGGIAEKAHTKEAVDALFDKYFSV